MMVILYILLFIVCLSTLVMIHELGHLLTAKMFKVYCFEYSIGFGPKLFSRKRKNGETYFSLRAIPFGGFVSMYGESESVPEGLEIDPKRSLLSIAKWKRAIIMVAGITMNFLLAIVLFIVYEGAFPQYQARYGHVTISDNSIAAEAGLNSGDFIYTERYVDSDHSLILYDNGALLTYSDDSVKEVYFGANMGTMTRKNTSLYDHAVIYDKTKVNKITESGTDITISDIIEGNYNEETRYLVSGFVSAYVKSDVDGYYQFAVSENYSEDATNTKSVVFSINMENFSKEDLDKVPLGEEVSILGYISKNEDNGFRYVKSDGSNAAFNYVAVDMGNWLGKKRDGESPTKLSFKTYVVDPDKPSGKGKESITFTDIKLTEKDGNYYLPSNIGFNMQLDKYYNSFGDTFKNAFSDFADAGSLIYRSLGSLFTDKDAWNNVGGIIAIGVVTTRTLQESGFGTFLYFWAIISVNLAIVNLLPFPGLDGWHFLVIIVEAITRKEIPPKVKNWFSLVGLVLLFALMILVVIKDIITFI